MPDPDILIRTGNTNRLSNFLLWQLSYSEIFFVKKLGLILIKKILIKSYLNLKKLKEIMENIMNKELLKRINQFNIY